MNCFFCNFPLDAKDAYCLNPDSNCRSHYVVHCFFGLLDPKLFKVEFIGLYKDKELIISYLINPNQYDTNKPSCTIIQRIPLPPPTAPDDESVTVSYDFKELITVPYPPITLTPNNYKDKLSTYLLFS